VTLGCVDGQPTRGYRCLELGPRENLSPSTEYTVVLGELADDLGLRPQGVHPKFTTGEGAAALVVKATGALPCAVDEIVRQPFCVRINAWGFEIRGATDTAGALVATAAGSLITSAAGTNHRLVLDSLPPASEIIVSVWPLSLDGTAGKSWMLAPLQTAPSVPRVRITEVLAHPFGSSAQEFVEVINDGPDPASLSGLVLATRTGTSRLPPAIVRPGERAVIIGPGFDPRGTSRVGRAGDPALVPGTNVVRLTTMLATRGLTNSGTDVWLADLAGHILSRAPGMGLFRSPGMGVSLVRADSRMKEDDLASWSYDAQGGSSPGLPDRLR
jgi:hypothetical protein